MKLKETIKKLNSSAILTEGQEKAIQVVRVLVLLTTMCVFMYCTVKKARKSLERIFKQLLKENLEDEEPKQLEESVEKPLAVDAYSVLESLQTGEAVPVSTATNKFQEGSEENNFSSTAPGDKNANKLKLDNCRKAAAKWVLDKLATSLTNAGDKDYAKEVKSRLYLLASGAMRKVDALYGEYITITISASEAKEVLEDLNDAMSLYAEGILPIIGDYCDVNKRKVYEEEFSSDVSRMYRAKIVLLWYEVE